MIDEVKETKRPIPEIGIDVALGEELAKGGNEEGASHVVAVPLLHQYDVEASHNLGFDLVEVVPEEPLGEDHGL